MNICAFDVETYGPRSEFQGGSLYSDRMQRVFEDPRLMIEALREHATKGYTLAAHNAEYDVTNLLWRYGEDVSLHFFQGSYTCGYWHYGHKRKQTQIWDSLRLAAGMSLKTVGEGIGVPKYEIPRRLIDKDDIRQDWVCQAHLIPGCLECYALRDSEIVYRYMNMLRDWLQPLGINLRRTLPAIAVELWKLWDTNKAQTVRSEMVKKLARMAYHGGRCEVFKYGTWQPVYTYDIRSHYGVVMQTTPMADVRYLQYRRGNLRWPELEGSYGVVEATVFQPDTYLPILPVSHGGSLFYPTGTFQGAWSIAELSHAILRGAQIDEIHQAAWSRVPCYPFANTAGALLHLREELRKEGNPLEFVIKLLLNALFGRLGIRDEQEKRIYRLYRPEMSKADMRGYQLESADGRIYLAQTQIIPRPAPTANILWAVQITSAARVRLYQELERVGKNLIYCDTDSVHSLMPVTTTGDGPGQLRDTGQFDIGRYLAPKQYRLESFGGQHLTRAKGVPARVADDFIMHGSATYQTAIGVIEGIARNVTPGFWIDAQATRHLAPSRRHVLNLHAISQPDQTSDSVPVTFSVDGSGGFFPSADLRAST